MTRFGYVMCTYFAIGGIVLTSFIRPAPRLIWNASASVPIGLYSASPTDDAKRGDLVSALPPKPIASLMAARRYLPLGVPMLKHVGAVAGQRICRVGAHVKIDGISVAEAKDRDHAGRPLPAWFGCRTLHSGEIFLLNPASSDSFDGRYFGPIPTRSITAILTPIWLSDDARAASERRQSSHTTTAKGLSK